MNKRLNQKQISQQTILDSATDLFAEQGYDCTSIRQIAERAGISLGLLYNYYKGKEEVLREILVSGRQRHEEFMKPSGGLTGWAHLESFIKTSLKAVEQNKPFWRLYYSLRLQSEVVKSQEQESKAEILRVTQQLTQSLAEAGSTSPSAEAVLLLATVEGIAQQYLLQPAFPLQDVLIRHLVQLRSHLKAE